MAFLANSIQLDGSGNITLTVSGDDLVLTSSAGDVKVGSEIVASQTYVNNLVEGLSWKNPVSVLGLIGNASCATINGLTPAAGDAYVVTDADTITLGSISTAIGDMVEYNGTIWIRLSAGAGGFVADGVRAILSTTVALITPYTDSTDDGKIMAFDGTSLTGANTGDAVDKASVLIQDAGHLGYYDNLGFVFEGAVPTGSWTQFTGGASFTAGNGLTMSSNILAVGQGSGISVGADAVAVSWGGTGAAETVSRSDHNHDLTYAALAFTGTTSDTFTLDSDGGVAQVSFLYGTSASGKGIGVTANSADSITGGFYALPTSTFIGVVGAGFATKGQAQINYDASTQDDNHFRVGVWDIGAGPAAYKDIMYGYVDRFELFVDTLKLGDGDVATIDASAIGGNLTFTLPTVAGTIAVADASKTLVTNLNADQVDGLDSTDLMQQAGAEDDVIFDMSTSAFSASTTKALDLSATFKTVTAFVCTAQDADLNLSYAISGTTVTVTASASNSNAFSYFAKGTSVA